MAVPGYDKKEWNAGAPPDLSAENLNIMDTQIQALTDEFRTGAVYESPALTGIPTAPSPSDNSTPTRLATTGWVDSVRAALASAISSLSSAINSALGLKANIESPTFTGTVTGTFNGNLTGNVTGNVSGSSGSCYGRAATAGNSDTTAGINFQNGSFAYGSTPSSASLSAGQVCNLEAGSYLFFSLSGTWAYQGRISDIWYGIGQPAGMVIINSSLRIICLSAGAYGYIKIVN